jgi:predicted porin
MKKSLLALAVFGAFAGAASAQSSVTVYGIVDVNVTSTEQGGERVTDMSRASQSPSRIGFKGVEDLGNGLKASFVLEQGFDSSNGGEAVSGLAFQRNAWVGLDGGFGTVRFGRQDTPIYLAMDSVDPFGTGTLGDIGTLFESLDNKARTDNMMYYKTPTFGGFAVEVSYAFGEVAGENAANRSYGAVLGYENGPLVAKLAYNEVRGGGSVLTGVLNAVAGPTAGFATGDTAVTDKDSKNKDIFAGVSYDFGAFKLHGAYLQSKFQDFGATIGGVTGAFPDFKLKSGMVGVSVPLGAGTFLADYAMVKNDDFDDADSKKLAIGYTYALSKRTNLYTVVSRVTNDDNVGRASYGSTDAGDSSTGYQVGLRHSF